MSSFLHRIVFSTFVLFWAVTGTQAATITVGGIAHETVSGWSVSNPNDNATGSAGGNSVTLQMPVGGFNSQSVTLAGIGTYSGDAGFNDPSIIYTGGGTIQRILPRGAAAGTSTLTLSNHVSSLLLLFGIPNSTLNGNSFNDSEWNFPDNPPIQISVLDQTGASSGTSNLTVNTGNVLAHPNGANNVRARGIIQLTSTSPFNTLSWTQQAGSIPTDLTDQFRFALAVGPATVVPTPSALLLMGTGLIALIGWNYQTRKKF